jgi:hypothetical protein
MRPAPFALLAALLVSATAHAQDREYCPDRPGLGTPACTMSPGALSVEVGLADWTGDGDAEQRVDTFVTGDALLRYGIARHAEMQLGWAGLGFARERDRSTGEVDHRRGAGDLTLALRRNLAHPDGSGLSAAVMPFVTLPIGSGSLGDGDWSAGMQVPVSYAVSPVWSLATTSEIDAAANEDSHGRHLAFAEIVGASAKLSATLTATVEYEIIVDREPSHHHVEHVSGLSLGWQPASDTQLDLGANLGLDHDAQAAEIYLGVSRRF